MGLARVKKCALSYSKRRPGKAVLAVDMAVKGIIWAVQYIIECFSF